MDFCVSVIIPAYNVEGFIEKAILSVIKQPEVYEILVVNDGSTDNTLNIIERLSIQYPILKILYHDNKVNNGRSASRNLGIRNATSDYIAFLDADDFYLENRFNNDRKIFKKNIKVHGVYNAIGNHFYRNPTLAEKNNLQLFTITKKIEPENLIDALLSGRYGYFSIDGLTVKRSVFELVGLFNEELVVAEDTELIWKMALMCTLQPGLIDKPIAMRGIHDSNVSNRSDLYEVYEIKMYESLYFWTIKNKIRKEIIERFLERISIIRNRKNKGLFMDVIYWVSLHVKNRAIISLSLKYFPVILKLKRFYRFITK